MSIQWDELAAGQVLPEISLDVDEQTVILVPVATWDLFPGHHSPAYARSQGQKDMYLNTIALQGMVDRAVTDHLGPRAWIQRRKMSMLGSVYPGDRLRSSASCAAVRREGDVVEADFSVSMTTAAGPAVTAELTASRIP